MRLETLLKAINNTSSSQFFELDIRRIVFHSKQVRKGDLFVAINGVQTDGHNFIDDAVSAGAQAVIGEKEIDALPVPYFKVTDSRIALAKLSAELYGHPYSHHTMIGITGTNGKTTTAHMIRHVLEYAGQSCALFGTVERYFNGKTYPSDMTTYDAVQMQQWLEESRDENVVMEVSSHGLDQKRVEGMRFDYALFTNLSHEHLDYHETMDHYFNTKAHLFHLLKSGGKAIINTHSSWGRRLARTLEESAVPVFTFGQGTTDTLQLIDVQHEAQPVFHVRENNEIHTFKLSIPGTYNIWNALGAILLARRKRISFQIIKEALASFPGVPGRLETHRHPNGALFVVDYAHTPEGLAQCLEAVRVYKPNRLIHVFGFRGNRDDSKWEVMYNISKRYSDQTILTLDDLNGVSQEKMLDWYRKLGRSKTSVIADRTRAIMHAWNDVEPGDCVVITGKGPESYDMTFDLPANSDSNTISYLKSVAENR